MRKNSSSNRGFTMIELLTVIAIIGILAGLLFPAISTAMKKTKIAKAQVEVHALETAWLAYFNEYGQWPIVINGNLVRFLRPMAPPNYNADVVTSQGLQTWNDTTALLQGVDTTQNGANPNGLIGNYNSPLNNQKLTQFTNLKKDPGTGQILDPWGHPYKFLFDSRYANQIGNNYLGTVGNPIPRGVIVWSMGPDGQDNTADDIRSWQ